MAVPFGFSVGDFITVGQLIQKITVELQEVCSCLHCSTAALFSPYTKVANLCTPNSRTVKLRLNISISSSNSKLSIAH